MNDDDDRSLKCVEQHQQHSSSSLLEKRSRKIVFLHDEDIEQPSRASQFSLRHHEKYNALPKNNKSSYNKLSPKSVITYNSDEIIINLGKRKTGSSSPTSTIDTHPLDKKTTVTKVFNFDGVLQSSSRQQDFQQKQYDDDGQKQGKNKNLRDDDEGEDFENGYSTIINNSRYHDHSIHHLEIPSEPIDNNATDPIRKVSLPPGSGMTNYPYYSLPGHRVAHMKDNKSNNNNNTITTTITKNNNNNKRNRTYYSGNSNTSTMARMAQNHKIINDDSEEEGKLSWYQQLLLRITRKEKKSMDDHEENVVIASPNEPQPSLDYLPLHFFLRRFPFLIPTINAMISFRWYVSYPLQRRIPLSRLIFRKLNIFVTIGELLLLLPFAILTILGITSSLVYPDISLSGHAARIPLIFAFVTAVRNSYLTLLLGIPFERVIWYHKLSARLCYINGYLHTFAAFQLQKQKFGPFLVSDSVNTGGTFILVFITLMIITALPMIRRRCFEFFQYIHIICSMLVIVCAFYHTGLLVPILTTLSWGFDLFLRRVYFPFVVYPRKATIRIVSESVLELSFPSTTSLQYNPGQYMYLAVPQLSPWQWHPFSISSSPGQKIVTMHIRKAGTWTNDLYQLADNAATATNEISILLDGPYGSVGVNLFSKHPKKYDSDPERLAALDTSGYTAGTATHDNTTGIATTNNTPTNDDEYRYNMIMLFSGGIGVTPMQSLCNQIMYEYNTGLRPNLQRLSFIWIERDPQVMTGVDVVRRSIRHTNDSNTNIQDDGDIEQNKKETTIKRRNDHEENHFMRNKRLSLSRSIYPSNHTIDSGHASMGIASTLLSLVPASAVTDEQLEQEYPAENLDDDDDDDGDDDDDDGDDDDGDSNNKDDDDDYTMDQTFLDLAYDKKEEGPLDLQVYLTGQRKYQSDDELSFINTGRPDIKQLFLKMKREALSKGERRIAVCTCAPQRVITICQKACVKYSDSQIRFDIHHEVFG